MAKATIAEIRRAILKELPKDGTAVGNQRLQERIAERFDARVKEDASAFLPSASTTSGSPSRRLTLPTVSTNSPSL